MGVAAVASVGYGPGTIEMRSEIRSENRNAATKSKVYNLSLTEIAQIVAWRHGFNDLDLDQHADGKDSVVLKAYGPNRSLTVRGSNTMEVVERLLERLEGN